MPPTESQSRTRARRVFGLAVALGSLLAIGGALRADEPDGSPEAPLRFRMFDVGDLTCGRPQFFGDPGPDSRVRVQPRVDDAEDGGDAGKRPRASRSADDLLAWLRERVATPADWAREGVEAKAVGEREIDVRAPAALLEGVDRELAALAREAWPTVTVDVMALSGDAAAVGDGDVATEIRRGALSVLGAARACGAPRARIVGRHGGESALVSDYDVEVAVKSNASEPVVTLRHDGICFDATTLVASENAIHLTLNAWWARPLAQQTATPRETGAIALDAQDAASASATLDLRPGVWQTAGSSGSESDGVVFVVRATLHPYDVKASPFVDPFPIAPLPPAGPLVRRVYALNDLFEKVQPFRGRSVEPRPSSDTPSALPELPEAFEPFPRERLIEVIRRTIDPVGWRVEGASVDLREGRLYVRADGARQAAIERLLDAIRDERLRSTRVRAVVATMPLASLPEYFTGLDDAGLVADGGAALLARSGARVVQRAAVSAADGQWQTVVAGRQTSYVSDFDVEIAEEASIGDPIMRTRLEGTSFHLRAFETALGGGIVATIDFSRSAPRATRSVSTPHGEIECPDVSLLRMLGTTTIPLGATRLVSANVLGGEVTLVLLSATAESDR